MSVRENWTTRGIVTPAQQATFCSSRKCRIEMRTERRRPNPTRTFEVMTVVKITTRHVIQRFGKRVTIEKGDHDADRALLDAIDEMNRALGWKVDE